MMGLLPWTFTMADGTYSIVPQLLSKAHVTLDTFAHNIAIKRYCNKKTFFIQYFFFLSELKKIIFGQFCLLRISLKIFLNVTTIF